MKKKNILIVVDMQNDFLDKNVLGNQAGQDIIDIVRDKILLNEYDDIIATRDTHTNDYLSTQEGIKLPVKHCVKNTIGWEIYDTIQNALNERQALIIDKRTFGSPMLAMHLQEYGDTIESITLCGVCTGICVISNALLLKAFFPEITINVDANACACVTAESHQNALNAMSLCQINIIQ